MGLFSWFRRRRQKKETDVEAETLERTGKLQTEVSEKMQKKPKRARKKRTKEKG